MNATIAHTSAPLRAIRAGIDSSEGAGFRTFASFADACAANLDADATQDDAAQLCAILTAARDHRASMPFRMMHALGLAIHCARNPIDR